MDREQLQDIYWDMGQDQIADLLGQTLAEEKKADEKLTELATSGINREAAQEVS